ncbi:ABC transporter ATP-binding protein [Anaerocolumna xylanovorans]|uniref:Sulfonate transport system ATP-binding protein n=1 Tax=Anaerocolumna xylanovorans DSM 12503 TaxID=1121345 RepID=A0A1M7XWV5_9FIRM|nr:ATP-binding cassette domain-containing protein [Anaerocolumna xylanovorans]SHO43303.1 sulfonate transport system ATP-binding protein [Anaerocolumna xylanovorans DSM 12503]
MSENANGYKIELKNVKKRFGQCEVLEDVSLTIESGEFVAIVGHSGCGKSTLLRMIAGLDVPTEGTILVNEKEVTGVNSQVRFLFQEARLLPWKSVIANVIIGTPDKNEATAAQSLERVGLINKKHEWPKVLSGGQKQRVSLARALAGRPNVLLLDEPLGALDAFTRLDMQELIEKLWLEQGFTGILVTHDVSEAVKLANRVILMEDKEITLDMKISLPRPRQKDNDSNYFEHYILDKIMKLDEKAAEVRREDYAI